MPPDCHAKLASAATVGTVSTGESRKELGNGEDSENSQWILAPGLQLGDMDNAIRANDNVDDTRTERIWKGLYR
jgi:hypothetical protein